MNNKPVAWTTKKPKTVQDFSFYQTQIYTEPLYTHPVKELMADEIHETAKQFLKSYDLECNEGLYGEVAWMAKKECQNGLDDFFEHSKDYPDWQIEEFKESYIPLYTHPVKELTQNIMDIYRLSDQSIQIVFTSCRSASEFEAILRKAQEK